MTRADLVAPKPAHLSFEEVSGMHTPPDSSRGASLKRGQPVTLVGFGTFSVSRRKPRKGKNPRTGQPMNVAGGRTPKFKPSPELKRVVR